MTFGISDFSSVDEAQARRIIDAFLDSGHCFEETMRRWTASCARQAPLPRSAAPTSASARSSRRS